MTRSRDVSAVQNNLGVAIPPAAAGKNAVINGGFDIWQRGTSFTSVGYTADRWYAVYTGTVTITRQTSGAPNGSQYYIRQTVGANNSIVDFMQFVETANVAPMWGQTVTLSFKIRRNSTLTQNFGIYVQKNSTVDAGSATAGWTGITTQSIANSLIPTGTTSADWYNYSTSFTIPNDGTANSIRVILEPTAQMSNGAIFDLAQIQLELGSSATPFSRAGGTIQGELAACQRYYTTSTVNGSHSLSTCQALAAITVDLLPGFRFPVAMRTAPTVTIFSRNGTSGKVSATATGLDAGTTSAGANIGNNQVWGITSGSLIVGAGYEFSFTASAEL